jgi:DNA-binding NtrC family response regulator
VILRAIILSDSDEILEQNINFDEFPDDEREQAYTSINISEMHADNVFPFNSPNKLSDLKSNSELNEILNALKVNSTRDNAARDLGISPRTLRQKLNDFRKAGLPVPSPYART